jgi:TfoX/Sxy family transcriptional regulator of competence genes
MAFDEGLAERVRMLTEGEPARSERKMFGGLCFMREGNMFCGVLGDELMVRVGPAAYTAALEEPHARVMDFTGRSSKGIVYVDPEGISEDDDLERWLAKGIAYAASLPPK